MILGRPLIAGTIFYSAESQEIKLSRVRLVQSQFLWGRKVDLEYEAGRAVGVRE